MIAQIFPELELTSLALYDSLILKIIHKEKNGLGHDLHHFIIFFENYHPIKRNCSRICNPENQEAATFALWHGTCTQAGLVEITSKNKDRGIPRLLGNVPIKMIKNMLSNRRQEDPSSAG